jgi:uncharacterized protein (TIGR03067 family)
LALAVGAPGLKPDARPAPAATLAGVWAYESMTVDGTAEPCAGHTLTAGADGKTVFYFDGKPEAAGTVTTETSKDPHEIDWVDDASGDVFRGIWKLDNDVLTLCLNGRPMGERPTAFESGAGSHYELLVLKRAKKKD